MRSPALWFFVLTFALTAIGQALNLLVMHRLAAGTPAGTPIEASPIWTWKAYGFYVTNLGPSLVGICMTFYLSGLAGIGRLAAQLAPWSSGRAWPMLAVCLMLPPAVTMLSLSVLSGINLSEPPGEWQLSAYLYSAIVTGGLLGPGICEELGWRGFALPYLQRHYSALKSSLIIGVAWALWHWPNYFVANHPQPFAGLAIAVPLGIAAAILYTFVYNSTQGSLFAVVVLHGATVSTPNTPDFSGVAVVMIQALYVLIAIGLVWRFGAENLTWRAKTVAERLS